MDRPVPRVDAAAPAKRHEPDILSGIRALVLAALGLTAVVLLEYLATAYAPQFNILRQRSELPVIAEKLLYYSAVNRKWLFVPSAVVVVVVLLADFMAAHLFKRLGHRSAYSIWFVVVVLAKLFVIAIVYAGLIMPVARLTE